MGIQGITRPIFEFLWGLPGTQVPFDLNYSEC